METVAIKPSEQLPPPLAIVQGRQWLELPKDLYIPPDALQVFLETFEGPLDLLLYLIKKQNLDILNIPIAQITAQYMQYVDLMHELQFELAAEYLLMAAMLAEIKSRMLLPRQEDLAADEADPRAELIRRLQEYERFKQAAMQIDELPQLGRDFFPTRVQAPETAVEKPLPKLDLQELVLALQEVMRRVKLQTHYQVKLEHLSVRERMASILEIMQKQKFSEFKDLFNPSEGRMGVVVTFLAILELLKQAMIEIIQKEPFSPIHISAVE